MAEVELLADGLGSPEGPDFLPDGRAIFVETFLCRVSAWDPRTGVHAYADVGGAPTACVRGLDGVYVAQNGRTAGPWRSPRPCAPSIQRIAGDGRVEIVADSASCVPLLGPNDLAFAPDGSLWFTDPAPGSPARRVTPANVNSSTEGERGWRRASAETRPRASDCDVDPNYWGRRDNHPVEPVPDPRLSRLTSYGCTT
jgi:sugar lactone lactonase YvrE